VRKAIATVVALLATATITGPASAGTNTPAALEISPGTAITTLNHGARISGASNSGQGVLPRRLANATVGIRAVGSTRTPVLLFEGYTQPAGVTVDERTAHLFYAQKATSSTAGPAPSTLWTSLTAPADGDTADDSNDPGHRHLYASRSIFVTADRPGTYRFRIVDPSEEGGTDDDTSSPVITMTVLDVNRDTSSALSDDWRPAVTAQAYVGVDSPLTAKVDLTGLTLRDARGSTNGVGVLNKALADLTGIWWDTAVAGNWHSTGASSAIDTDAIGFNLRMAGVPTFKNYTSFEDVDVSAVTGAIVGVGSGTVSVPTKGAAKVVNPDGTATVPAQTDGVTTLKNVGKVVSYAVFDRNGTSTGVNNGTPLIYDQQGTSTATSIVKTSLPSTVTLSATPASCVGMCTVKLAGTAQGATTVAVSGYGASPIVVPVSPADGTFSVEKAISRTTVFRASAATGASDPAKVTVKSVVKSWSATGGKGKITVSVTGGPRDGGQVYVKVSGYAKRVYTATGAGATGAGTFTKTLTVKKGTRTVKVGYDSPRASISGWTPTSAVAVS
jgi:hypothetical protein